MAAPSESSQTRRIVTSFSREAPCRLFASTNECVPVVGTRTTTVNSPGRVTPACAIHWPSLTSPKLMPPFLMNPSHERQPALFKGHRLHLKQIQEGTLSADAANTLGGPLRLAWYRVSAIAGRSSPRQAARSAASTTDGPPRDLAGRCRPAASARGWCAIRCRRWSGTDRRFPSAAATGARTAAASRLVSLTRANRVRQACARLGNIEPDERVLASAAELPLSRHGADESTRGTPPAAASTTAAAARQACG